jgi:serine protease
MRVVTFCLALASLLVTFQITPALAAERQGTRLAAAPEDATRARVIVSWRSDAILLRNHPATRANSRERVAVAFQRRADALAGRAGVRLVAGRAVGERAQVLMATGLGSAALAARLAGHADIESVVVDQRRRALMLPNDPLYGAGPAVNLALQAGGPVVGQWYLQAPDALFRSAINAAGAWDRTTGSPDVVVAVLDTGIRYDHVDLQGRLLTGYDFVTDTDNANDGTARDADASDPGDWITVGENASGPLQGCGVGPSSWHGTKVAGIIGAATNNSLGMAGIAHGSRILPVRVLGKCGGYDSDIAAGMRWAAGIDQPGLPGSTTPARVLNLSLGGTGSCSVTYQSAVAEVNARGAVVVAAAGNSVGNAVGTPANCPGVIAVAGLRHAGTKVGFSDLGPEITIAAPGGNCVNITAGTPCLYPILTTANAGSTVPLAGSSIYTDSFDISVGTSFATPIVAGTVALMLSARPELTPAEVRRTLQATARAFPTSGADNGPDDPTPVAQCVAPTGADQLQCYCSTGLCGAGMLDAAGAVAAVAQGPYPRIAVTPASPVAGSAVQLSGAGTLVGAGRSVAAWEWALVSGGGVVSAFSGASNAASTSLQPAVAGSVTVRLTVTDDLGARASADASFSVASAPVVTTQQPAAVAAAGGGSGGGGGGALSAGWLGLLALAAAALGASRPRAVSRGKR